MVIRGKAGDRVGAVPLVPSQGVRSLHAACRSRLQQVPVPKASLQMGHKPEPPAAAAGQGPPPGAEADAAA